MTETASQLYEKLGNLCKGLVTKRDDPEYQIRLLKGVNSTSQDLIVELRADQLVKEKAKNVTR